MISESSITPKYLMLSVYTRSSPSKLTVGTDNLYLFGKKATHVVLIGLNIISCSMPYFVHM